MRIQEINSAIPLWKRIMDITVSFSLLIILSPLLILTALLIKLDSKGPIFYSSLRVGKEFRIFGFYKFRTMHVNADQLINDLKKDNQYQLSSKELSNINGLQKPREDTYLLSDSGFVAADQYQKELLINNKKIFSKIVDDPRITRVGRILRNTSIDELPQLFNVLIGDMSLVGNRPIPIYEAEKLTIDKDVGRFLGPSGMTGLWQINSRGNKSISGSERKQFDVKYALGYNFWMDVKILIKTIPAILQKTNV